MQSRCLETNSIKSTAAGLEDLECFNKGECAPFSGFWMSLVFCHTWNHAASLDLNWTGMHSLAAAADTTTVKVAGASMAVLHCLY